MRILKDIILMIHLHPEFLDLQVGTTRESSDLK